MPPSTTSTPAPKSKALTPTTVADALEKSRERIRKEFENSSYADVAELVCKLMAKYTREEIKE